ncbi:MAG: CDP-alcohol phosphatidyltransferase family protein [Kiritimatiellia bacterium]|jgi:CDP-diacylglycerol--glycerol-3-phosphate 3-phosphatidyltransferase
MSQENPSHEKLARKRRIVTWLTLARAPLILVATGTALVHAFRPAWGWLVATILCMIASALTDLADGGLARKWGVTSRFGALADPMMDKVFYVATLPAAVFIAMAGGALRHAAVLFALDLVSMLRDQWVSFLRSVGSAYNADVRATWSGKFRTAYAFHVIVAIYLYLGLEALGVLEKLPPVWADILFGVLVVAEVLLIVVTFVTGWRYTLHYMPYLRRAAADD